MALGDLLRHYYSCNEEAGADLLDVHGGADLPAHGAPGTAAGVVGGCRTAPGDVAATFGQTSFVYPGTQLAYSFWARRGAMVAGAQFSQIWFTAIAWDQVTNRLQLLFGTTYNASVEWPEDEWIHVTLTYDDVEGIARIYQDGTLVIASDPLPGLLSDPPAAAALWLLGDGPTALFNGAIDEIAIFEGIPTPEEIAWLHNAGAGRSYRDIVPVPIVVSRSPATPMGDIYMAERVNGYEAVSRLFDDLLAGTVLTGLSIKLFTASGVLNGNVQPADFTEATFAGYAAGTVAGTPTTFVDSDGNVALRWPSVAFQPTDGLTPESILGFFIVGSLGGTGDRVLTAVRFTTPVAMNGPLDALFVQPTLPLGQPKTSASQV